MKGSPAVSGVEGIEEDAEEPFVQVNCAASVDGKLSTRERRQVRISSDEDMERVQEMRAGFDAIAVGIGTVLADDPALTSKSGGDPLRVVVDSEARTPPDSELFSRGDSPVVVAASEEAPEENVEPLRDAGAEILRLGPGRTDLSMLVEELRERGVSSLMVEGGGKLIFGAFEAGVVDRISVFTGGFVFGGRSAPTVADGDGFTEAEAPRLELLGVEELGGGVLAEWGVVDG